MSHTVTVTGHGSAHVVPDSAVVRLGAARRAPDVARALAAVDAAVTAIGTIARRFTEARHIGSTDLGVWPAYDGAGQLSGYEARHSLRVVLPDLAAAGALLSALAEEVGDDLRVDGISLEVTDDAAAVRAAREAAYVDARQRAEHLAGLAGRQVGDVVAIAEGPGGAGPVDAPRGLAMAKEAALEPGERAISASLTITWKLTRPE